MATENVVVDPQGTTVTVRRTRPFSGPPVHLSWSAIIAGAVAGIAVWALMWAFGLAIGLSAISPEHPDSLRGSGIFTGIWSFLVPIVALFVGGAVASRASSDVWHRVEGALHGVVVWGLVTLAGAWMLAGIVPSMLGGAGAIAAAGGAAVRETAAMAAYSAQSYDQVLTDALRPMNQRLAAEGKAQVRPEDLRAALSVAMQDALVTGDVNREGLVTAVTQTTPLTRADAESVANQIQARYESLKTSVQTTALRAADMTGKAFWGVFGVMFLGLLSALAGSTIGVAKRQRTYGPTGLTTPPSTLEPRGAHT